MALFDLLGRSWSMGVLWSLAEQGPCTFRALQEKCENISPAVLNARLRELRASCLIGHGSDGYFALPRGEELYDLLVPMGGWAKGWARDMIADAKPVTTTVKRKRGTPPLRARP